MIKTFSFLVLCREFTLLSRECERIIWKPILFEIFVKMYIDMIDFIACSEKNNRLTASEQWFWPNYFFYRKENLFYFYVLFTKFKTKLLLRKYLPKREASCNKFRPFVDIRQTPIAISLRACFDHANICIIYTRTNICVIYTRAHWRRRNLW